MAKKTKTKKTKKIAFRRAKMMFLVLFMLISVVCIEIATITVMAKHESSKLMSLDKIPISKLRYNDGGKSFDKISVNEEYYFIIDECEGGCNLQIDYKGTKYKYIIERNSSGEYYLSIVHKDKYLSYKENIGTYLRQAYIVNYNGYLTFATLITNDEVEYDHAIIVNDKQEIDRFTSLQGNEMEFTKDGIIYYYDVCLGKNGLFENGKLIKAIRNPFSNETAILAEPYTNFEWCN